MEKLYSKDAEQAVIGAVIIDPEIYHHLLFLKPSDFYLEPHQWTWAAIGRLLEARMDIDTLTIGAEMDKLGLDYGGNIYLFGLTDIGTSLNAMSHARIVEDFAKRRGLVNAANEMVKLAMSEKDIDTVMAEAQTHAGKATERSSRKMVSMQDAASDAIDSIISNPRYFSFGVKNLDDRLGGIFPERLYIWAGYQGTGKSAFKIQNCRQNAERGYKVMDVSLEMSPTQTMLRMACGDLGVDIDNVLTRRVDDDTLSAVVNKAAELGDLYKDSIVIYPAPMSLTDILSAAKTEQPDIIWIDHSNLITGKPKEMTLLDWAGYIPRYLRQNISKLGISVHLLQQLNRGANKDNRRPNMHDIRLAGEDDPDMITLLYRPETPNLPLGMAEVEFICDKNRFGWTGIETIMFDLPHQTFKYTDTVRLK